MGSVVFSDSFSQSYIGYGSYDLLINYSETYNSSTNKTTIRITDVALRKNDNDANYGDMPVYGSIKVNGTTLISMDGSPYYANMDGTSYRYINIPTSGSVEIQHNDNGQASTTFQVIADYTGNGCTLFGAFLLRAAFGVETASKTVDLTDRGCTLTTTVSPSGYGTVTGGATLAPGKTKSLTATPTAATAQYAYAFSKWSFSGTGAKVSSTTANPTTFTMGTANATVTANFTRSTRSYTVSCQDRVGSASGTLLGTKTQSFTYGSSISGASFGSSTTYDAYYTGYHYTNSSPAITVDGNETVYRYFTLNTWTVSYNANNGSGAPSSQTKTYNVSLTLSSTVPTRTGYDFLGWSTSSTATTATYSAGGTYTANAGATLYAVWRLKTYTISYNANGGTGAPSSQTKTYGVNLTLSSTVPTKTGYNFLGWSKSSTATTATYSAGGTYTANEGATLYAVWKIITYTISYNANGGTGAPSAQTKTYGVNLTLSSTEPTRSNSSAGSYTVTYRINYSGGTNPSAASAARTTSYTFSSWNTWRSGGGTTYSPGGTYSANSAATLYAQWSSTTTTASVTLPTPTRTGYTFKGWSTSSSASTGVTGSYTPTQDVTLYAIWELKSYTLSISRGNGTTITVKRNGTTLSNGATIYHFDVLSISISANTGYTIQTHTVNNTTWNSGDYTVGGNVSVVSTATLISYTLSLSYSSNGVYVSVNRTSSPIGNGSLRILSNGDKLYYNDVIEINYTISGAYQLLTATVNNIDISTASLPYNLTVKSNVVISVTAKLGAIVYIGNEAYQAFIGTLVNGSAVWQQYQAFIGNGSTYDQY